MATMLAILIASHCWTVGGHVYCNDDDGSSASGYSIGDNQYYTGRDAHGGTWQQHCWWVGDNQYCN